MSGTMLLDIISNGRNIIESITGDTFPEFTTAVLPLEIRGFAEGIDTEFLAQGLRDYLIRAIDCFTGEEVLVY